MRYDTNPFSGLPVVVKNLLIINVIMFLVHATGMASFGGQGINSHLGLHYFTSPLFKPWQLVTYMFMHANLGHLFWNMLFLFLAGSRLEYHWGSPRFLTYYMITGIGSGVIYIASFTFDYLTLTNMLDADQRATVVQSVLMPDLVTGPVSMTMVELYQLFLTNVVGASGAIYALLLAFGMLFPDLELMLFPLFIPVKVKYLVFFMIAMTYYNSFLVSPGDNVAHLAHLGGMVVGFGLIRYWQHHGR